MGTQGTPAGGWNLFARILQEILVAHHSDLGKLDDHPAIHVHKEKVRRLKKSIQESAPAFPMLTPDEIDRVITTFHLSEGEQLRLRAAVLATAIEITLMGRIKHTDALMAAEEILPILERVLQNAPLQAMGIRTNGRGMPVRNDGDIDSVLAEALGIMDRATLAFTLSSDVEDHQERLERLHQAERGFEKALTQLNSLASGVKQSASWQMWHDEASHNLALVAQQLALLDG